MKQYVIYLETMHGDNYGYCDRQVCDKCAIVVNSGIHFCKRCYSKLR